MKCVHCSECSGPHVAPNIMPLDKVEQYIGEFCAMPLPKWEYMVFTGGTKILFDLGVSVSQIGRAKQNNIGEVRAAGF